MNAKISFLGILFCAGIAFSAEDYSQWGYCRSVTINTSASGANITATQRYYPILLRLNAGNFNFNQAAAKGQDVRFAKANGTHLPYQIDNWDSTNQNAAVWVLLDSVYGNNSTQSFRMYHKKSGAVDSSNGAATFDTLRGFQGVFHLSEATNDTTRDVTARHFKGIPQNIGGQNPQDVSGLMGRAKNFLGSNADSNGGSYRIVTSTGANTFTKNALNFQDDSSTINGIPQYTISAWINVSQFPNSAVMRKGIISKSKGRNGSQYDLRLNNSFRDTNNSVNDTPSVLFSDGPQAVYKRADHRLIAGTWHHVAVVRAGPVGAPGNLRLLVDGVFACSSGTSLTQTIRSDFDVTIGSFSNDSGFFNGVMDEVRFENMPRANDWIKLSYETQKPAATSLIVGGVVPPTGLSYKRNPLVLTTTAVMVPDTAVIQSGTLTGYSVSPPLPAGLSLNLSNGIISGTPTVTQAATNYTVTATGTAGATTTILSITINSTPVISVNPVNVSVFSGINSGKFFVKATGTAPLTYRWSRTRASGTQNLADTGKFTGSTTDTLRFSNMVIADTGLFRCWVTNVAGSAGSTSARLSVITETGILGPYVVHVKGLSPYSFRIPDGISSVRLTSEDMMGRVVWKNDFMAMKSRVVSWNGSGMDGRPVSPGMYVVRMKLLR